MTSTQQFIYRVALTAGYDATCRAWAAMRPVGPFYIGHPILSARAALRFAIYEMEGRR